MLQSSDDGPQLSGRPSTSLGSTSGRGKGGVQSVNVNGQVDRVRGADALEDSLDNSVSANGVNVSGLDNLKATVAVVVIITGSAEGSSDTGVDVGVVGEQAFHGGVVKVGAVVDAGDVGGRTTKDLWFP